MPSQDHHYLIHPKYYIPSPKIIGFLALEKKIFKVFTIYWHGGHLGHVTESICINCHSPAIRSLQSNVSSIGQMVSEKSKWLCLGNGTITYYRPTHGILRKSQRTITAKWHLEHNISKATCSLFPSEMITNLERTTQSTAKPNKDLTLTPTNNESNNKQWINYSRTTDLERTAAEATRGFNSTLLTKSSP